MVSFMTEDTLIFSTEKTTLISLVVVLQNTQQPQSHGSYHVVVSILDEFMQRKDKGVHIFIPKYHWSERCSFGKVSVI